MFKKIFAAAWMALLFCYYQVAAAATSINVLATPSNPTAPATVTLSVAVTADGAPETITQVEYFSGTNSLGVVLNAPFELTLNDLAAGSYQIAARASTTSPDNPILQSAPITLAVGASQGAATAYFIHTDQLNSPRAITDNVGGLAWQWESDPFGIDGPNEQPSGSSSFNFALRFDGQQADKETNLHYNYFRDYDPQTGRYIQSDPIGLAGGVNTYGYVDGNPVRFIDPYGLFNPTKGISAAGNAVIAGASAASGGIKIAIAVGLSPAATTGVGALPPIALAGWGTWNLKSSMAAWGRAKQQWAEAQCESMDDATAKNFWGMAPQGTNFDDKNEPGPWDYIKSKGVGKVISEAAYF